MKNHDFALDTTCTDTHFKGSLDINPNEKYIIFYRKDVVEQLEAWYRYFHKKYDLESAATFCSQKLPYYESFVNKWVKSGKDNVLVVDYNEFVSSPYELLFTIMSFLYPDKIKTICMDDIREVVDFHYVQKRNSLTPDVREYITKRLH